MQVRSLATSGSTRSESAHCVQACTQVKQASIAAARSEVPIRSGAGEASSIWRVLVMPIENRVGAVEQQGPALNRSALAIADRMVAAHRYGSPMRTSAALQRGTSSAKTRRATTRTPDARLRPLRGQTAIRQRG